MFIWYSTKADPVKRILHNIPTTYNNLWPLQRSSRFICIHVNSFPGLTYLCTTDYYHCQQSLWINDYFLLKEVDSHLPACRKNHFGRLPTLNRAIVLFVEDFILLPDQ